LSRDPVNQDKSKISKSWRSQIPEIFRVW